MNTGRFVLILVAAAALCGCGPVVTLKNPQSGAVASCRGGTFVNGMSSERVAQDLMTQCVDGYLQQGYEVVSSKK